MFGRHFSMPFVLGFAVIRLLQRIQDQRRDEMRSPIHAYPAYTCFIYEALTQLLLSELRSNPHLPILVDATKGSLQQNILINTWFALLAIMGVSSLNQSG